MCTNIKPQLENGSDVNFYFWKISAKDAETRLARWERKKYRFNQEKVFYLVTKVCWEAQLCVFAGVEYLQMSVVRLNAGKDG